MTGQCLGDSLTELSTLYYEQTESESEDEDHEEDDDYFSVESVDIDEEDKEDHTYCEKNPDVSGAASFETPADGSDNTAKDSGPGDTTSIHSRENQKKKKRKKRIPKRNPLKEMKKIWSQRFLLIMMSTWVL